MFRVSILISQIGVPEFVPRSFQRQQNDREVPPRFRKDKPSSFLVHRGAQTFTPEMCETAVNTKRVRQREGTLCQFIPSEGKSYITSKEYKCFALHYSRSNSKFHCKTHFQVEVAVFPSFCFCLVWMQSYDQYTPSMRVPVEPLWPWWHEQYRYIIASCLLDAHSQKWVRQPCLGCAYSR